MAHTKDHREEIFAFELEGERYDVASGREALFQVCLAMEKRNPERFKRLPELIRYRDKFWFSRFREGMNAPRFFSKTEIYLDTNLNTKAIKKIAYDVIEAFGIDRNSLCFHSVDFPAAERKQQRGGWKPRLG